MSLSSASVYWPDAPQADRRGRTEPLTAAQDHCHGACPWDPSTDLPACWRLSVHIQPETRLTIRSRPAPAYSPAEAGREGGSKVRTRGSPRGPVCTSGTVFLACCPSKGLNPPYTSCTTLLAHPPGPAPITRSWRLQPKHNEVHESPRIRCRRYTLGLRNNTTRAQTINQGTDTQPSEGAPPVRTASDSPENA